MNHDRITIDREAPDCLSMRVWVFNYHEDRHALILEGYHEMSRATKRHRFKADCSYSRLMERDSRVKMDAVEIPADVVNEAREQFIKYMQCVDVRKER